MKDEEVLEVIDKLTNARVTLEELEELKPLIGTEDFTDTYLIVESMETALQPIGRAELKSELESAAVNYHEEVKVGKLRSINRFLLPAIAASLLVVCATNIVHLITDYNNPKNFRKTYIETIK